MEIAQHAGDQLADRAIRIVGDTPAPAQIARVVEANGCAWSPDGASIACSSGNAISLTVGLLFGNVSPSKIVSVMGGAYSDCLETESL